MKTRIYILTAILLVSNIGVQGKTGQIEIPSFQGRIKKTSGESNSIDSVAIYFNPTYSSGSNNMSYFRIKTDKEGAFSFRLPTIAKPAKVSIAVFRDGRQCIPHNYFVEPRDSISIEITKKETGDSIIFLGRGAEKYNLIDRIQDLEEQFKEQWSLMKLYKAENLASKLVQINSLLQQFTARKTEWINKSKLGHEMQYMINVEYGNLYSCIDLWLYQMYQVNFKDDILTKLLVKKFFNSHKLTLSYGYNDLMSLCPKYLVQFSFRIRLDLLINSLKSEIDMKDYYSSLKSNSTGLVRERLVSDFFLLPIGDLKYNQITYDSLLNDAEKLVSIPFLKKLISSHLKLSKGKKAFNSEFFDLNDNNLQLKSLKGKVILLDMWGWGCSGCALFHKLFDNEVYPIFKDNSKFIVLSISVDKTKDLWIKGIKSGLYTSENYYNVNTGKLGISHPFPINYNINSIPFLLLIDKNGNIYSSMEGISTAKEITDLITAALNEPAIDRSL